MTNDLPRGWTLTNLGEVAHWGSGGTPSRNNPEFFSGTIPWIKTGELRSKIVHSAAEYISEEAIKKSSAKIFPAGSVGIAMYGATIGKLSIFGIDASTNQACAVAIPKEGILYNEFLYYYLLSERRALIDSGKGGAQPNISQGLLKEWPIPLPPIGIQHRIVAKIETLFSELDKGVESLKTAREQLKVYRQAVLKHAFEGKLTAQWREENKDKLESPEQLLARIQQERQARYQQHVEKWEAAAKAWERSGKEAKKPAKPRKPEMSSAPTQENAEHRYALPESWIWKSIGELFDVFVGSTPSRKNSSFWGGDIPWVSSGEVAFCNIKDTRERITRVGYENTSTELHPVGTVMLAMIGEGKTRGQSAILNTPATHNQNTAAIRVSDSGCVAKYLYYFFLYQYEMTRRLGSGNNQKALNKQRVSSMALPLCSILEQENVVNQIEEKLSVIEKNEQEIAIALARSESLRQSILKQAFSGKIIRNSKEN